MRRPSEQARARRYAHDKYQGEPMTRRIEIRLFDDELDSLIEDAKTESLSVSDFVRAAITDYSKRCMFKRAKGARARVKAMAEEFFRTQAKAEEAKLDVHYQVLGLMRGASLAEIKQAYRRLAKQHHPDLNGGNDDRFRRVKDAYETLTGTAD